MDLDVVNPFTPKAAPLMRKIILSGISLRVKSTRLTLRREGIKSCTNKFLLPLHCSFFSTVDAVQRVPRQLGSGNYQVWELVTGREAVVDPDLELRGGRGGAGFFECVNPKKNLASIFTRIYT